MGGLPLRTHLKDHMNMAKRTLTFFFLTICISLLNAQAEDHWAVSLRAGFGSTTADEAITQITLISAEDEIVREVDMGMMAGYTGGIDLRLATTDKYLFSASLDVLDVSDRSQVYANTNGFIDDGRGRQITEQNSYLAATAAIGVHYRITEDDSKLDWQVGGGADLFLVYAQLQISLHRHHLWRRCFFNFQRV